MCPSRLIQLGFLVSDGDCGMGWGLTFWILPRPLNFDENERWMHCVRSHHIKGTPSDLPSWASKGNSVPYYCLYTRWFRNSMCCKFFFINPFCMLGIFLLASNGTLTRLDGLRPAEAASNVVAEHVLCAQNWGECPVAQAVGVDGLLVSCCWINNNSYTYKEYCGELQSVGHY